jgi:hypothetical protein
MVSYHYPHPSDTSSTRDDAGELFLDAHLDPSGDTRLEPTCDNLQPPLTLILGDTQDVEVVADNLNNMDQAQNPGGERADPPVNPTVVGFTLIIQQ